MGDIVNLRSERKRAERAAAEREAAANRQLHGRSKAQRKLDAARKARTTRALDSHRLETAEKK